MPREVARSRRRLRAARLGATSSTSSWSSVRARSAASRRLSPLPSPRTIAASRSSRSVGSIAGGTALARRAVERAADPLVQLGIADRDQPRQQQPAAARPHERIGDRPHRAIVGQQDAPAGEAKRILAEPRDQPRRKRIGERAVRRDGDRRRPAAGSAILERRFRHRDRLAACRRRTTGPGGPRRSSALPRSPGPRGCWSRTAPPARRGAAASRRSGCR